MTKPAHSPIGASSMYRWAACPGSIRLSEGIKNRSSEYAAEGTVAHDIGAQVLEDGIKIDKFLGTTTTVEGHEITVTQEMLDAVQVYVDAVSWAAQTAKPGTLIVMDYKHGAGLAVEVKDNPQLEYYALGSLLSEKGISSRLIEHKFDLTAVYPGLYGTADCVIQTPGDVTRVEMVIVQPRCPHPDGPVRRWTIDAIDLMDFTTELIDYAKATEDPAAPLHPGDHCRFCPAAGTPCTALKDKANAVAASVFAPGKPYDPKVLADTLLWLPVLESWAKSVREFAYAEAEAGNKIPGWKLVAKVARRKWRDAESAVKKLLALGLTKTDIYGEAPLVTPAAAEKLLTQLKLKPADRAAALEPLTTQESSGHTLAEESDKRPAVKQGAAEAFSNV
jgi:hypothetical protein